MNMMTTPEAPVDAPKETPPRSARRARLRRRHIATWASFIVMVLAPVAAVIWYFDTRAAPQFSSSMSFSIRSESFANPLDALAGLGQLSTGATADADIVHEFISSQKIVRDIDAELGLRALYGAPERDPVFDLAAEATLEELVSHWRWMVQTSHDTGSGLIHVESFAFTEKVTPPRM